MIKWRELDLFDAKLLVAVKDFKRRGRNTHQ